MASKADLEQYRLHLLELRQNCIDHGLELPTEFVTIIPGTEAPGRPLGAKLPIYPEDECGTDDTGAGDRTLFNLRALTGFTPPIKKR